MRVSFPAMMRFCVCTVVSITSQALMCCALSAGCSLGHVEFFKQSLQSSPSSDTNVACQSLADRDACHAVKPGCHPCDWQQM